MDRNDQQAIEGLFDKLAHVERQAGQRDDGADRFIRERIASQPGAPYFMAQTIVVQEQALEEAQRRIEALEHQLQTAAQPQRGGFLAQMFGSPSAPQRGGPQPGAGYGQPSPWGGDARGSRGGFGNGSQGFGAPGAMQPRGGGFLAGAAQTAMGVAGGVLLGNAIMGMMGGDEAHAAPADASQDEPGADAGEMDIGLDEMNF
jgi:uncharacterized protein